MTESLLTTARHSGHLEIASWAIANGCLSRCILVVLLRTELGAVKWTLSIAVYILTHLNSTFIYITNNIVCLRVPLLNCCSQYCNAKQPYHLATVATIRRIAWIFIVQWRWNSYSLHPRPLDSHNALHPWECQRRDRPFVETPTRLCLA